MRPIVKRRILMASRTQTEKVNDGMLSPVLGNDKIVCKTIMSESNSATSNRGLYSSTRRNLQLSVHLRITILRRLSHNSVLSSFSRDASFFGCNARQSHDLVLHLRGFHVVDGLLNVLKKLRSITVSSNEISGQVKIHETKYGREYW